MATKNSTKGIPSRVLKAYHKLMDKYFPNCYASGISGSYATGISHKYSDIDLIIISEYTSDVISEIFNFSGFLFDAYVYPKNIFENYVLKDINNGECTLIDRLKKIVVLKDHNGYLSEIKKNAGILYARGPVIFQSKKLAMYRFSALSCLNSLKGNFSREQNIFIVSRYMENIIALQAIVKNIWIRSGKYIPDHLKENDPIFYRKISFALEEFYKRNQKQKFVELLEELLSYSGNMIVKRSNSNSLNEVDNKYIVIGFLGVKKMQTFILKILPLVLKSTTEFEGNFYFYTNRDSKYKGVNYFMVLHASDAKSLKAIQRELLKTKIFLENNFAKIKIVYPFNLLPRATSKYAENLFLADKYFNFLSSEFADLVLKNKKHEYSLSIKLAYEFTLALIVKNNIKNVRLDYYIKTILEEELTKLFISKNGNYLQWKSLILNQMTELQERFQAVSGEFLITRLRDNITDCTVDELMNVWAKKFEEIFDFKNLSKNNLFSDFVQLESSGILKTKKMVFEYMAFRETLNFFFDLIGLRPRDKCFCFFVFENCIKKQIDLVKLT